MTFMKMAGVSVAAAVVAFVAGATSASALTMKECSVKFQAAKAANTLGGQTWNDFRAKSCAEPAAAAPAPAAPAAEPAKTQPNPLKPAPVPAKPAADAVKPVPAKPAVEAAKPAATGDLAAPGKEGMYARARQCGAEWRADKDKLKAEYKTWPKYWSACNTRIKTTGK